MLLDDLREFLKIYERRPIGNNTGGMDTAHMFHVWRKAKELDLPYIIESGIWKGQSSWLLEEACPGAKIFSLDPILDRLEYKSPSIEYSTSDFVDRPWDLMLEPKDTLCFFDDHYGWQRIVQAQYRGFVHLIYEDNYHDDRGHPYHPSGKSESPKSLLSKSQHALDSFICHYEEFPPIYFNDSGERSADWAKISEEEYKAITVDPILKEYDPEFDLYYQERSSYTWIAYIILQQ